MGFLQREYVTKRLDQYMKHVKLNTAHMEGVASVRPPVLVCLSMFPREEAN